MFCAEPIVNMFYVYPDEKKSEAMDIVHPVFTPTLKIYFTENTRLVFETENHKIIAGAESITMVKDLSEYPMNQYYYENCVDYEEEPPYFAPECAACLGERIQRVTYCGDSYWLEMDTFQLQILPYPDDPRHLEENVSGVPLTCFDRLIHRKCICGGKGEVLMDIVRDFFVRCNSCHRFTWSEMGAEVAIDWWNEGDVQEYRHAKLPSDDVKRI